MQRTTGNKRNSNLILLPNSILDYIKVIVATQITGNNAGQEMIGGKSASRKPHERNNHKGIKGLLFCFFDLFNVFVVRMLWQFKR